MENDRSKFVKYLLQIKTLWGRNISEIPCFRNSYLYGISTGIAAGLIYFMCTSKIRISSHIAVTVFAATTLSYWTYCRHKWETDENTVALMKELLKDRIAKEGTQIEKMPVYEVSNSQKP
ncbi:cytochrome c oxidase assembly factor COX20 lethal (3) 87Df isoform X1 [Rhodnius prolixus]|uniref:cytochrome c oxidase assembly factor COX20 lethal (3) 87Df isoform X1 n=1 Tax=Rhodnius prolixus TaxID=13249 RepID=UPI003D18A4DD